MAEHAEDLLRLLVFMVGGGVPLVAAIFAFFFKRVFSGFESGIEQIRGKVAEVWSELGDVRKELNENHDEVQMEIAQLDKRLAVVEDRLNGHTFKAAPKKPRTKN